MRLLCFQAVERLEEMLLLLRRQTLAVVAHGNAAEAAIADFPLHPNVPFAAVVLDGVLEYVDQRTPPAGPHEAACSFVCAACQALSTSLRSPSRAATHAVSITICTCRVSAARCAGVRKCSASFACGLQQPDQRSGIV